jgi:hypothetical protein
MVSWVLIASGLLSVHRAHGQQPTRLDTLFVLGGVRDRGGLTVHEALAAVILPDGQVALSQADGIHLADADGQGVRRLAREGQGPGEVNAVWAIDWDQGATDLIWYDFLLLRFTRLDLSTNAVATHRIRPARGSLWPDLLVAPLADGRVLALDRRRDARRSDVPGIRSVEDTAIVVLSDSAGSSTRLGSFPRGRVYQVVERQGATGFREGSEAPPGGRRLLSSAAGGRIALAYSDDATVNVLASDGSRRSATAPVTRQRLGDAEWREIRAAYLETEARSVTTPDGRAISLDPTSRRQRVLDAAERPEWRPLFDQVQMSVTGEVWVREVAASSAAVARWHILRRDGGAALVTLPANLELLSVRDRTLVARVRDALDVESVVVLVVR